MKQATKSAAKLMVFDNDDAISIHTQEIEDRIRERAYQLSQQRGHAGRDVDDWLTAESEIISVPPTELIEKDNTFQVRMAVVGIDLEDIRVMTSSDQMLVRGDYRHVHESDEGIVHLSDFKSATLFRSVRFPEPIDVNTVAVDFQNGILRVIARKAGAQQARPKRAAARKAPAKRRAS
jgi:HSP20 family molecular chaperone IbpA